jgi:hypothetical protein
MAAFRAAGPTTHAFFTLCVKEEKETRGWPTFVGHDGLSKRVPTGHVCDKREGDEKRIAFPVKRETGLLQRT